MTIQKVYEQYRITPALQLHQYRVAAVSQYISSKIPQVRGDENNILTACLLHDMGNIIKFNMDLFPEFFQPEGVGYWRQVKEDFINTYGTDEHTATIEIAKEVLRFQSVSASQEGKLDPNRVIDLIESIGFSNAKRNAESTDFGWKIAAYSDMRVEPYGVTTLESRLEDGNKRFKLNKPGVSRQDFFTEMSGYLHTIQEQLFADLPLGPDAITEETVQSRIAPLANTELR